MHPRANLTFKAMTRYLDDFIEQLEAKNRDQARLHAQHLLADLNRLTTRVPDPSKGSTKSYVPAEDMAGMGLEKARSLESTIRLALADIEADELDSALEECNFARDRWAEKRAPKGA
jgi:hypothetical protein